MRERNAGKNAGKKGQTDVAKETWRKKPGEKNLAGVAVNGTR
jgi:hypothetical protein